MAIARSFISITFRGDEVESSRESRRLPPHQPHAYASSDSLNPSPIQTGNGNEELLGAFFVGRATASTLSRQIGQDIVQVASNGVSLEWLQRRIATRDERIEAFRDSVLRSAAGEMESQLGWISKGLEEATSKPLQAGPPSDRKEKPTDVQAEIDELRANIASVRAMMNQMKE